MFSLQAFPSSVFLVITEFGEGILERRPRTTSKRIDGLEDVRSKKGKFIVDTIKRTETANNYVWSTRDVPSSCVYLVSRNYI